MLFALVDPFIAIFFMNNTVALAKDREEIWGGDVAQVGQSDADAEVMLRLQLPARSMTLCSELVQASHAEDGGK